LWKNIILSFEYFIAKRIRPGRSTSYSGPVVRIAYVSIALGLALMIISVAIVVGFKHSISQKVTGFAAPLKVIPYDKNNSLEEQPLSVTPELLNLLKHTPGITHVQLTAQKAGVLKTKNQIQGVVLKGVGPNYNWQFLKQNLTKGRLPQISIEGKASNEVLISKKLADRLEISIGDAVRIWFISGTSHARGRKLTVTGIYDTGLDEFDNRYLVGDIKHIRKLNGWKTNQTGSIELLTNNMQHLNKIAYSLYHTVPFNMTVETVLDEYPEIYNWLNLLDTNVIVILVLMTLVAGITMVSTLFILIIERTNMVGVLKALGATNISIRKIFLYKAADIVGKGILWGNVAGIGFYFLQDKFHIFKLDAQSYYISYVPVELHLTYVVLLNLSTFVVCLLMLVVPSFSITRIMPAKALRYE